jgi:hypothetical protein
MLGNGNIENKENKTSDDPLNIFIILNSDALSTTESNLSK